MQEPMITPFSEEEDLLHRLRDVTETAWEFGQMHACSAHGPFLFLVSFYEEGAFPYEDGIAGNAQIRTVLGPIPSFTERFGHDEDPVESFREVWERFREAIPNSIKRIE